MRVSRFGNFDNSELDVLATALYNLQGQGKVTSAQAYELRFLSEEIAVEKEGRIVEVLQARAREEAGKIRPDQD